MVFIAQWRGGEGELMVLRSQFHGNSRHGHAFGKRYISYARFNPCIPAGELECDRADYRLLLPQQSGPSNANSRGSHFPGHGGGRYKGTATQPPDL